MSSVEHFDIKSNENSSGDDQVDLEESEGENDLRDNNDSDKNNEEDEESLRIRNELSQMSFEELNAMKERLETKVYGNYVLNNLSDDRNLETICKTKPKSVKESFKRVNKNRPREESSKRAVPRFREIYPVKRSEREKRDPRFDERCGTFDERIFRKTFSFLDDIKKAETTELMKELKKTKDENRRKEIEYLLQRRKNQEVAQQQKLAKVELVKKFKKEKKEKLGIKNPKKTIFVNKGLEKKLELAEKFKTLKKSGKLEKYLEKKRKQNANRERKKLGT